MVQSMREAAAAAGVTLVTGDTKVVDRGKADSIFINTSGIGLVPEGVNIHPRRARPGDKIIVSGEIAVHGIAIMSVREGLEFETEIASDTAPLNGLVEAMLRRRHGHPRSARPDPRRHHQRAERDRPKRRRRHVTSTKPASRSARKSKARAKSSGSTRSTSPMKASFGHRLRGRCRRRSRGHASASAGRESHDHRSK